MAIAVQMAYFDNVVSPHYYFCSCDWHSAGPPAPA